VSSIPLAGPYDLALTANYGTDEACTGGGDPNEAASWAAAAVSAGITVSHMTVGNEEYGSWETDLHANPHDPATYAEAVTGSSGYYELIKAASPKSLVGVVVDADNTDGGWDNTVLANAKGSYDFVEFHYYPEAPGQEDDTALVQQLAPNLTTNLNILKAELAKWGTPNTPIYVGEMGSVYTNPGKQSWSITQGLFAGQVLGEMMNDGVSRATWWIGFGNCNGSAGNDSSALYGWQDFGAYNVFSDGPSDNTCPDAGPIGTMSPTARAYQLFSNIAINGESVLTPTVTGDTTDVRAYAATNNGGTALFLFNTNETTSQPVTVTVTGESTSPGVTVITYDKAVYDQSQTDVWAAPTATNLGQQTLPLTLTLTPWSMNVVLIK
jgi:predicted heme/steroid binding protein